jgi:hypothetical protein
MKRLTLRDTFSNRHIALVYLIVMNIQYTIFSLPGGIYIPGLILMALAPFVIIMKSSYLSKASIFGGLYLASCILTAYLNGPLRITTILYLGMYVVTYIAFYGLVSMDAFSLSYFTGLLRRLIIFISVVLILQQICILLNITYMPIINLSDQYYLAIDKLPSVSFEPSVTARLMIVLLLCYFRCKEISWGGKRVSLKYLFSKDELLMTALFLWTMFTQGSGTGFVGLGILSLYFIRWRTVLYVLPLLCAFIYIGQKMELSQFDRAYNVAIATSSGNIEQVQKADGSAVFRVVPLINTLKMDLTEPSSWIGRGNSNTKYQTLSYLRTDARIMTVDYYGLIALLVSFVFVFNCMIRKILSIETLLFMLLFSMSLPNVAYIWGAMMFFTTVRYFQVQYEQGLLDLDEENDEF